MRTLALFLTLTFAFSSPSFAQVKVDQGGTGTTANTGASGRILVGQGNSTFLEKAMSGDCTLAASGAISCTASGSSITFDIGDDGGNDSTALAEIATTGDTNGVITEPSADKALIDFTKDWPKADLADALAGSLRVAPVRTTHRSRLKIFSLSSAPTRSGAPLIAVQAPRSADDTQ